MPMSTDAQGRALSVLNRVAQADWPDRFKLRKPFEKLLYTGSRAGFQMVAERSGKAAKKPRAADPDALFDLSLSDEQQMIREINALAGLADWVLPGLSEGRLLTGFDDPAAIAGHTLTLHQPFAHQ
eukprot:gene52075-63663_t